MMYSGEELDIFYKSVKGVTIDFDSTNTLEKLISMPVTSLQWLWCHLFAILLSLVNIYQKREK